MGIIYLTGALICLGNLTVTNAKDGTVLGRFSYLSHGEHHPQFSLLAPPKPSADENAARHQPEHQHGSDERHPRRQLFPLRFPTAAVDAINVR